MKSINPKEMSNENTILKTTSKNYSSCHLDHLKASECRKGILRIYRVKKEDEQNAVL